MRQYLRSDSDDATCAKSITDMEAPNLVNPHIEKVEPTRQYALRDRDDPKWA
jgi:hypothetical protein